MSDTDPRIVHVASELDIDLRPTAENDGNLQFILDVIDAVDYANEQCGKTYEQGQRDMLAKLDALDECYQQDNDWSNGWHEAIKAMRPAPIKGDSDD
jgi:hypothetical protein